MMDPLNFVSVDLSLDVYDGALATQGLNKPIKKGYTAELQLPLASFLHNI